MRFPHLDRRAPFGSMTVPGLMLVVLCCFLLPASWANAQAGRAFDLAPTEASGARGLALPPYRLSLDTAVPATAGSLDPPEAYPWRATPPASPDWRGATRDVVYYLGYQVAGVAILYAMPESVSGWSDEDKDESSADRWRENVTNVVWDEDDWFVNYVMHPYWGGAFYVRARERGLDRVQSFWFSTLLSTLWEYGAEALFEPVSVQDLVVTPLAGFLVGEYLFAPLRERIRAKPGELDWSDKVLLVLTDPLGAINVQVDGLFGVKSSLQLAPIGQRRPAFGFDEYSIRAARPGAHSGGFRPAWGLQLRMSW